MFSLPHGDLSLYIHIPMCKSRCAYCGFYSEPRQVWEGRVEEYTERLVCEIERLGRRDKPFHTIYIGGGDPANLGLEQLRLVLATAQQAGKASEVTVEVNPERVDERLLSFFGDGLATRLSMGIQTMDQQILTLLGRSATAADNRRSLALAQEAHTRFGVDLSIDLMVALPGQTTESALSDIDEVLSICDAQHLSLYCLTVEEGTALARHVATGSLTVLDEDGQEAFLRTVWSELARRGFEHYEVSNFAKDGHYSRHNSVYWNLGDYLGLGSGASSTLGPVHWEQHQDFIAYVDGSPFSGYESEETEVWEQIEEYVMMGLRTKWGIDKVCFFERFGISFDQFFSKAIKTYQPNWIVDCEQSFSLTEDGWMVLDEILLRLVMEIP